MTIVGTVAPAALEARIVEVLQQRALEEADARDVARALVDSSLRGIDTHGIRLLPTYLRELDGGRARARPDIQIRRPKPGLAIVEAGGALGIVAGLRAARLAAEMARDQGTAWVAVADSNHFGAASVYTLEICRRGMVGLAVSNADALMVPSPGREAAVGTNPLSIAIPTDGAPFCLDMATSQVAWSRVMAVWRAEGVLPPGWALDAQGRDCAEDGAGPPVIGCPLGGYKGAGLALAIELLSAGLVGARFGFEQSHLYAAPWDVPREVSHAFMALEPGAISPGDTARRRIGALLGWYRSRPVRGHDPLVVPGDLEEASAQDRADGIPVEKPVWSVLWGRDR